LAFAGCVSGNWRCAARFREFRSRPGREEQLPVASCQLPVFLADDHATTNGDCLTTEVSKLPTGSPPIVDFDFN
jgi:hypothetical protein